MKKLFIIATLSIALFSCSSSRQSVSAQQVIDSYGTNEQLTDTFLHRLQQENDVVMAAYSESLAWGRHYNYTIAVRNNGKWKGYSYTVSGTFNNMKAQVTDVPVDAKAADATLATLNNAALWQGRDNHETCNMQVNDGSTSYLLMAALNKVLKLGYYMPDAYQRSCPDAGRQLFLEALGKVRNLTGEK